MTGIRVGTRLSLMGAGAMLCAAAIAFGAVAAVNSTAKQPPVGARAKDSRSKGTKLAAPTGTWWAAASKNVAIGAASTIVVSLKVPAGTYELLASGSVWTTSGKALQDIGCHLSTPTETYGHAYASLLPGGVHQQPFGIVGVAILKSTTIVDLDCLLGANPPDGVSVQANLVVTKLTKT